MLAAPLRGGKRSRQEVRGTGKSHHPAGACCTRAFACGHNRGVGNKRKPAKGGGFLGAYRRIRKPMPPPEKVIADRRRRLVDEEARREIEEGESEREGSSEGT
ncbi:MAG: hypothetical protein AB1551_04320 [Actinomycetota bacterium]